MTTSGLLCFLPVRTALQFLLLARMFLAKLAVFWIFFSSPTSLLTGLLGHVVHSLLPPSLPPASLATLATPLLSTELVVDTLALVGIWRNTRLCLLPCLLLNTVIILAGGAGVVVTLLPLVVSSAETGPCPVGDTVELVSNSQCLCDPMCQDAALEDINRSLLVILLNMVLVAEMVGVSAMLRVFVDMGGKERGVSFSRDLVVKPENKPSEQQLSTSVRMYEQSDVGEACLLMDNPNITITLEDEGVGARNSWDSFSSVNSVKFTFDKENFE